VIRKEEDNGPRELRECQQFCVNDFSLTSLVNVRHAVFKLDGEVAQGGWPVRDGFRPFAADVLEAQIKQLEERLQAVRSKQIARLTVILEKLVEERVGNGGVF
jgi:hypothetical protein